MAEGSELFGLPPRKRFKVMEQQRRREEEEESPRVHSHCTDITNTIMPLQHRVLSPTKVTSQGFLVLEKQKYKLQQQQQQQRLQENLVPAMPPLPPRPVAMKRKEPPALPLSATLSAPPTTSLKLQGERTHSLSPSAFESWSIPRDSGCKLERHERDGFSVVSEHAKVWTMAKGTTCSVNKAQADVEMTAPVLSSSSEVHVSVPTIATSSTPVVAMDLVWEGDIRSHVDDHMARAAQIVEVDTKFPSAPVEDVIHEAQAVEEEGRESKVAGKHDSERAVQVEVVENEGRVVATTLGDPLGRPDIQETDTKQDSLVLANIDERADNLFKRMLEREGYDEGCKVEQDDFFSQFLLACSGVNNNIDSIEVEGEPASQAHEDFVCSEVQEIDSSPMIPCGLKHGSSMLKEHSQEADCKSSKEDAWDLEMEIPDFSFGKRSGMTQRVKAPGLWTLQSSGGVDDSTNLDEDEDEEDGACDVCLNPDAEPSNPIVYCDGCDVPVHADCYGSPLCHGVPEGDWFCSQCQNNRSPHSRNCCLCPRSSGAMKMTTDGNWAHLSCALFVPEVFFRKADDLEGIDTSHVPSKRWLSSCCVCRSTGGACVDCTEIGCKSSFHVSCAFKKDLALEFRNGRSGAIVISFCQEHTAAWNEQQEARKAGRSKYKIVSREPQKTKASQRSKLR